MHSEALALFSSMMWESSWTFFSMVGVGFLSLISMLGFVVFNSHRAPTVESTRCSTKIIPQKFLIWKMLLSQMLKIFLTYFIFIWNYPGKKVLSLDEFKGNSGGQKYNGIVVDAKQHKVIDILPNRFENELIKYFSQFPSKTNVKYFVTDMNPHFREVSKVCFPNAIIVADRYHVIRQAYWAMERVRKNEQNKLSKQFRKYFKKSRCLLIRKPRLLYTPKAFHTEKLFYFALSIVLPNTKKRW